mgnify:CR=1 FL=1
METAPTDEATQVRDPTPTDREAFQLILGRTSPFEFLSYLA